MRKKGSFPASASFGRQYLMGWQAAEGADRDSRKSDRRGKTVFGCTGNAAGNSGYHAGAAHDTDAGSQRACAGSAGYTGGLFITKHFPMRKKRHIVRFIQR